MAREPSRNQRGLIQQQQLRREFQKPLSGQFDARIARAGETQAFYPLPRGMGAPAQIPQVLPVLPGDVTWIGEGQGVPVPVQGSDAAVIQAPYPGPVPLPVEPMPDFPLDAAIFPTTVPWMLSIGNRPFPVRVERWYTHVLAFPTRSFTIPQDFILTELTAYGHLENLVNLPAPFPQHDPETYEINLRFNRTDLFSRDVMAMIIPESPYALQLPCPYYLPKGTEVQVTGGLIESGLFTWDAAHSTGLIGFGGYYVLDPISAQVIYSASRPMFYVRRFDVETIADETQTLIEPTVRDPRRFELNRLIVKSLVSHNTTIPWELVDQDPVDDMMVRLTIGDIFDTSNLIVNWPVVWGTHNFPRYLSPPVKVCSGTALQLELSQVLPLARDHVFYNYFVMGGKNIYA